MDELTQAVDMAKDVFGDLGEFQPMEIEDVDNEIKPLNGKYICEVSSLKRYSGTGKTGNEYDFYSLNATVIETVSGTKGDGRRLSKMYSLTDTEWSTGADNLKRLANELFTMGCDIDTSNADTFDASCEKAEGKKFNASVYPQKYKKDNAAKGYKKGAVVMDNNGYPKHNVRIVKEFINKKSSTNAAPTGDII